MDLDKLSDLQTQLSSLRNAPSTILKSHGDPYRITTVREQFKRLHQLADLFASEAVQQALAVAAKSEQDDKSDLGYNARRKRSRRPDSPIGSPQPYAGTSKNAPSPFPPEGDNVRPLRLDELVDYMREFNATHPHKLHIWTRTKGSALGNPVVARFTIPDVVTFYITLGYSEDDPTLVAECVTAFGPREKKSPYSQSGFMVYGSISQYIASLLQAHPRTSFQNLVNLLGAYEDTFIRGCSKCGRILSAEGHEPPVVLGFNPQEGEEGAPITVRIHFHADNTDDPIHVRLVIGNKPVNTAVRELQGHDYGRWQLDAAAPALAQLSNVDSNKVLVTVQALNADNFVLDSVPVGEFSYWDLKPNAIHSPLLGRPRAATHIPTASPHYSSLPSPSLSDRVPRSKTRPRRQLPKAIKDSSLVRTGHYQASGAVEDNLYAHTPILEISTPLDAFCTGWAAAELNVGRRLVRFQKVQVGRRVILSCETIRQDEYCDADTVISCIYREEVGACYVTSVDIIYLLERLTNDEFPVEEKNRIRRNLEGLRPTTVSKHKRGSEAFFQLIMDFPDPKPRNIEKDLKVFEWCLLGQALEKIMSKYSIYTSSPTDSTSSLPPDTTPQFSQDNSIDPALDEKAPLGLLLHFEEGDHHYPGYEVKQESDSSSGSNFSDGFPSIHDPEHTFDVPAFNDDRNYNDYLHEGMQF
ncbi:hypothetical protein MKEN_00661600 [Mycena kentingensis (nom. inval.)]|nr:hypothetical protein MKEN_00661600 [Mycena kentingensis (nom. inval.)]